MIYNALTSLLKLKAIFFLEKSEVYWLSSNQEKQLFKKKNPPGFPQSPNLHVLFRQ